MTLDAYRENGIYFGPDSVGQVIEVNNIFHKVVENSRDGRSVKVKPLSKAEIDELAWMEPGKKAPRPNLRIRGARKYITKNM